MIRERWGKSENNYVGLCRMPDGALFDELGIMVTDDGRRAAGGPWTHALRAAPSYTLKQLNQPWG
jgi:hypothetical protein